MTDDTKLDEILLELQNSTFKMVNTYGVDYKELRDAANQAILKLKAEWEREAMLRQRYFDERKLEEGKL